MNFLEALNTKATEVEAPLNLPVGTYVWKVAKVHKEGTTNNGEWVFVEIPVVPVSPFEDADDVDASELADFGDLRQGTNRISFMAPTDKDKENEQKRTLNNLKRFLLDVLKVEGDEDSTLKELLGRAPGAEFIAQATHRPDAERGTVFVDVKNWMPLP